MTTFEHRSHKDDRAVEVLTSMPERGPVTCASCGSSPGDCVETLLSRPTTGVFA